MSYQKTSTTVKISSNYNFKFFLLNQDFDIRYYAKIHAYGLFKPNNFAWVDTLYVNPLMNRKSCMRKHFHLIGHFLKNAQSSENICEIFLANLKNAQLSENACTYPRASILT